MSEYRCDCVCHGGDCYACCWGPCCDNPGKSSLNFKQEPAEIPPEPKDLDFLASVVWALGKSDPLFDHHVGDDYYEPLCALCLRKPNKHEVDCPWWRALVYVNMKRGKI